MVGGRHYLAAVVTFRDLGKVGCVFYFFPTHSESVGTDWGEGARAVDGSEPSIGDGVWREALCSRLSP